MKIKLSPFFHGLSYIPIGLFIHSAVHVIRYVCCACGYSEEWINEEDIPRLLDRYPRHS